MRNPYAPLLTPRNFGGSWGRFLKPDNVMLIPNPDAPGGEQVKVLDFGIAKVVEVGTGDSEANTRADAVLGTPRYMSPEQCRGGTSVDAKSDVYSLGVILFESINLVGKMRSAVPALRASVGNSKT